MNKRALKEFAVYARNELRSQIALRAQAFGITPKGSPVLVTGADYVEINGKKLPLSYKNGLQKLLKEIETKGYDQVIEEVAYTWFNRLIAIRYMEVHNYLPSKIRVLSSETKGKIDPDILTDYQYADLPVNKEEIASLLQEGKREEAYRKLLIAQCNELHEIMPFLFEKLADYTELLLPESLLHADSLINKLGKELDDENLEHVEVIGWLYQYYISEKKDEVFSGLKKNKKITKENIPAATQLFTPHWIVRYMVENSLGHMWIESHPESNLKAEMKYYVEPAEQEPEVQAKLEELRNPNLLPEDITILDPACGSGHILVYAFDLLYKIYEERGYPTREIPFLILEKNLYGIDIDDRAAQLAAFALMMKAREKTKKIFRNPPKLNIISIQESNEILIDQAAELIGENETEVDELKTLLETFIDAKNYGSILQPERVDFDKYLRKIEQLQQSGEHTLETFEVYEQLDKIEKIIKQAKMLASQYDVVVTNPPYMGAKGMNTNLSNYLKKHYKDTKFDLFAVFMERMESLTKDYHVSVTMQSWMFLSSFEKYRKHLINNYSIQTMVHMANMVMGIAFGTAATVFRKNIYGMKGVYQYVSLEDLENGVPKEFPVKNDRFAIVGTHHFNDIPGSPIAYWASQVVRKIFKNSMNLAHIAAPKQGLATGDNNRFLRFWFEVEQQKIGFGYKDRVTAKMSGKTWFPCNKGGPFRKWYGNNDYVVNWKNDGYEIRNFRDENGKLKSRPQNMNYYFKKGLTWSTLSNKALSMRLSEEGFLFETKGSVCFPKDLDHLNYLLGFLNSKLVNYLLSLITPTLDFHEGPLGKLPVLIDKIEKDRIDQLVEENITHSKTDWDSFENSWGFKQHPFLTYRGNAKTLEECYANWADHTEKQFQQLKKNEEELNRIFIELYGLEDELTPEVPDEEVTVRRADRIREAKSFLSYCIGLMMGRYSLDAEGLAYAGGDWDASKYKTFQPDKDGIIPLTETAYFEDDVITRLQELLILMFGEETLAENLRWLAESLTMKNNETPTERLRRYFFDEFYADHCKMYQKRPIYWMAESGSKKGFRALFYLHRYTPETLATMRFTYVQNLQEKLRQEQKRLEQDLINPDLSAAMKKRYEKQLKQIRDQQEELVEFDKKLAELANQRIVLDLDDGVVVNYEKLKTILAKIK
ncbi:BREX-1 system adenine-specific DNA-methyltransferase PglX [Anoxybacillus flavithermus]|uniref:BREX-1 system adenine-specific DNA-methyltransferase PglX n=1 Tax=Anoxybacillus flavithermus TaxID=33934 RepID=UPI001866A039|nr:BREX-1 system adenine-specific DNA-methyltransferase PglX [Anoxybacillus flavithermus]MBE2917755.1 BREX-1 system adenine-specific DNA-methyltransferase PglX [Anoxybacillus flavithermus]MBE2924019.1 BREX-1 system adenine-specific DNA-methyltransferase PglX [Anoxybacillus flavithermus]MBE2930008.1 BREX-1 system adenine-specific DNA-methyltransferase PglX [Anoxybacillus flavithermus]MBE2956946.1 BREX-1 system adenine-specific DNA-methyltransferase PglX [Anoxybacillus flavithermus]